MRINVSAVNRNKEDSNATINVTMYFEELKNFLDMYQPTLPAKLKRKINERYKTYVHRIFLEKENITDHVFRNKVINFEGFFVLQNAHKQRMRSLRKRFPTYSLKNIERLIN